MNHDMEPMFTLPDLFFPLSINVKSSQHCRNYINTVTAGHVPSSALLWSYCIIDTYTIDMNNCMVQETGTRPEMYVDIPVTHASINLCSRQVISYLGNLPNLFSPVCKVNNLVSFTVNPTAHQVTTRGFYQLRLDTGSTSKHTAKHAVQNLS